MRSLLSSLTLVALVTLLLASPIAPAAAAVNCDRTAATLADPDVAAVWAQLNSYRAQTGLPALTWSPTLAKAAAWMATDDATRIALSLTDSLGRNPRARATDCDYRTDASVYENPINVVVADPYAMFNIWSGGAGLFPVRYEAQWTVGALGKAYNPNASAPYYWVLDIGTQLDSNGPTATPVPATATPRPVTATLPPPTATPVPATATVPVATAVPEHDAVCSSDTIPLNFRAGQTSTVSVTMRNTGSATWSEDGAYRLGIWLPQDSWIWGEQAVRVHLPHGISVAPGTSYTFSVPMTAPVEPGSYPAAFRMVQEHVTWFGGTCGPVRVAP